VESLWETRQELVKRIYDQMLKPNELLTSLIQQLQKGHDAKEDGKGKMGGGQQSREDPLTHGHLDYYYYFSFLLQR